MAKTPGRSRAAPKKKAPGADGRCTLVRYGEDVTDEICTRIATGESWSRMANTGRLPSYSTLYAWEKRYPEFAERLAESRRMAADWKAEKALAVAEATTPATVSADRLKVGTLMKHAALQAPSRWGRKAEERGEPQRIIIEVRKFEIATGEDGVQYLREIRPEGGAGDGR